VLDVTFPAQLSNHWKMSSDTLCSQKPFPQHSKAPCKATLVRHGRTRGPDRTVAPRRGGGAAQAAAAAQCSLRGWPQGKQRPETASRPPPQRQGPSAPRGARAAPQLLSGLPARPQHAPGPPQPCWGVEARCWAASAELQVQEPPQRRSTQKHQRQYGKSSRNPRAAGSRKKLARGKRSQPGSTSLLRGDTHVLLAHKLGQPLHTVHIKHYCNSFRTWNCIKF